MDKEKRDIRDEIVSIQKTLSVYGFTFMDLTRCSPKASKTKRASSQAICFLVNNEQLIAQMRKTAKLPIGKISASIGVPRKIIERHRRYIIAAAEILAGDYPMLSEYLDCTKRSY